MTKIAEIMNLILGMPKTIYLNFKCLPIYQAKKMPISVGPHVKLKLAGSIEIKTEQISPAMIKIGIGNGSFECGSKGNSILQLQKYSRLIFMGKASISNNLVINNAGTIILGTNFNSNFGLFITCSDMISFGNNVLLGWNNTFIDNDGHKILNMNGEITGKSRPIAVGDHTWITSETTFLKGSRVADNCIVGYQSFVHSDFNKDSNVLIAGNPAQIVKHGVNWEK